MDNNIVRVQLASAAALSLKIESKDKNSISQSDQSFEQLLNIVSEQKVWNNGNLSFPISYGQQISAGQNNSVGLHATISANAEAYAHIIQDASVKYNVPEHIIKAVIQAESSFNSQATSAAGAKGLMQLMDGTAKGLGVTNSYDPAQNIDGGTKYLSMLLKKYDGELKVALAAYNAGPTRVDRTGISTNAQFDELRSSLPEETQNYVNKILSYIY